MGTEIAEDMEVVLRQDQTLISASSRGHQVKMIDRGDGPLWFCIETSIHYPAEDNYVLGIIRAEANTGLMIYPISQCGYMFPHEEEYEAQRIERLTMKTMRDFQIELEVQNDNPYEAKAEIKTWTVDDLTCVAMCG